MSDNLLMKLSKDIERLQDKVERLDDKVDNMRQEISIYKTVIKTVKFCIYTLVAASVFLFGDFMRWLNTFLKLS